MQILKLLAVNSGTDDLYVETNDLIDFGLINRGSYSHMFLGKSHINI